MRRAQIGKNMALSSIHTGAGQIIQLSDVHPNYSFELFCKPRTYAHYLDPAERVMRESLLTIGRVFTEVRAAPFAARDIQM